VYAQDLLDIRIDLKVEKQPVRQVLKELKKSYDISFAYSRDKLSLENPVTFAFSNEPLTNVLDTIFENAQITYKVIGQQIILRQLNQPLKKLSTNLKNPIAKPKKGIITQSIRGTVRDQDSGQPLVGASVWIEQNGHLQGVTTGLKGHFFIGEIPVGRHAIQVSYLGYQATQIRNLLLIAGKEMVLEINLEERTTKLHEVVIRAKPEHARPINEMAITSARSFSVEETSRYAASFQDPARMVTNYAGVTSATNDPTNNTISVRGNSPTANLWRLEGVDIPNPNHYATLGSGGGAISMLSSNMLAPSDFYTGAFPADFGNVLGGIFDLKLRKGNSQTREYSLSVGTLGLEASAEGPLKSIGPEASYLVNYRFSTLALLRKFGVYPVGKNVQPPIFQDLSFKVHIPTKPGNSISVFGLGGINLESPDRTQGPSRGKLEARGYMDIIQTHAQWKHRWKNNFTLNVGIHGVYFGINQSNSIEPRLSLYNVPVAESNISVLTQVNSSSVWNIIGPQEWINLGTARNYGLEWTFDKRFARNYYILSTLSLYHSRFSNDRINQLSTRFDQALNFNLGAGKEFKFGYNERNMLGVNFRLVILGGQPYTPINLDASIAEGRAIYDINNPFSERLAPVRRLDTGLKLQLNRNKITHTFKFDIQNTTLTLRERNIYYDPVAEAVIVEKGLSILPVILYKFEF